MAIFKSARSVMMRHSPALLTGMGVAGMITASIQAVKATPKALSIIEKREEEELEKNEYFSKFTRWGVVKETWKCYIPASITCVMSIACLVGASSINHKRNAALATAFALSETALKEYRAKVVETIGEKKAQTVRDAVAKDQLDRLTASSKEVIVIGDGKTMCYDPVSGRTFMSDIDKIKKAENSLNRLMLEDGVVTLNDFYFEIGLDQIKMGDMLGWSVDKGLITFNLSAILGSDGKPYVVVNYDIAPTYDFRK